MSTFLQNHCDGSGPHSGPTEVRAYPLSDGRPGEPRANLILCSHCWRKENQYRADRARQFRNPEAWPLNNWDKAQVYAREDAA